MDLTFKPIQLADSDSSDPKTQVLVFAAPVTVQVDPLSNSMGIPYFVLLAPKRYLYRRFIF